MELSNLAQDHEGVLTLCGKGVSGTTPQRWMARPDFCAEARKQDVAYSEPTEFCTRVPRRMCFRETGAKHE